MEKEKKIIEYFVGNIFEAKSYYTQWKMIAYAKSITIVGESMVKRYLEIQQSYPGFFMTTERASLISFVTLIHHNFDDTRTDNMSLDKVDKEIYDKFKTENFEVIKKLKDVRNKLFAHKSMTVDPKDLEVPSLVDLDNFFVNLEGFFNILNAKVNNSTTWFDNVYTLKNEIEILYMSIERGEEIRKKEIDIRYLWEENPNKISNKI
ncbi:hypothetical protein H7Y21_01825 [Arenimonas sp.]|nr:hypothetical protein [Candidatus Parcubacteria bacterium]